VGRSVPTANATANDKRVTVDLAVNTYISRRRDCEAGLRKETTNRSRNPPPFKEGIADVVKVKLPENRAKARKNG
jgi:hypothetical protein